MGQGRILHVGEHGIVGNPTLSIDFARCDDPGGPELAERHDGQPGRPLDLQRFQRRRGAVVAEPATGCWGRALRCGAGGMQANLGPAFTGTTFLSRQ
jgi:hypothetical protein